MRILIASYYLPWPLDSGGNAAQFSVLKCLEKDHEFTLVCPIFGSGDMANAKALQSQLPLVRVRPVFCGMPPTNTLVRAARSAVGLGRQLFNPSAKGSAKQPAWMKIPCFPADPLPEALIVALQDEISKGFDLCQIEFGEMLPLGPWLPKDLPKIFVHHQVHYVYAERFIEPHETSSYSDFLLSGLKAQEMDYLKHFDVIITFSHEDRRALIPFLDASRIMTSPFPIQVDAQTAIGTHSEFDGRFLFLGSRAHMPNRDALEWLLSDIWPEILRQLPLSRLVVIGNWSEADRKRYAARGVTFAGYVENLSEVLPGGIMLVPLRIGSGIRVKIMAAMAQGVPVVSTSVGSEGLMVMDGEELLVRDDKMEFAETAVRVAMDPSLWRQLAASGRTAVFKHYSPEGVRQRRNEIYMALVENKRTLQR